MKNGTLIIAPPGARNKREAIFQQIVSLCPGSDFSSITYLAPNTMVAGIVKRQFFSFLKRTRNRSAYIPFQVFTIKQLALQLYETFNSSSTSKRQTQEPKPSVISPRMRTLLLCTLLEEDSIGYAQILSDLYRKIRHYVPDRDLVQLKEEMRQMIFEEKTRGRALKAMETLQIYESFQKGKKLIDAEDVLRTIGAGQCARSGQPQGTSPAIVIEGFYDPTPLELKVLNTLVESVDIAIILADENTRILANFLLRKEGLTVKKLKPHVNREAAGFFSYNSLEEEVEGIARNIRKRIIEGVRPWEITVCFPALKQYIPMLRRVFGKYGIPVSIDEYPLSVTRQAALLEEIISCIENDYPRNDFLSILMSPCLPAISDEIKKRAVTFSYRAGIIKGKESWLSIAGTLMSINSDQSESARARIPEFQNGIKQVIDELENIRNAPDITAFTDAFESALEKLGFFDHVKDTSNSRHISHAITNAFSELRRLTEWSGKAFSAKNAGSYVRYLLSDLSVSNENIEGVKILPYEQAAAIESTALFFGGVIEGSFPSRPGIDPVLPEKVKKDLGLPYLEYYLERQSEYFKRLLNISSLDPYISCPSADGDKIFLPSPFLDWEKKLSPVDIDIFTEEDALVREGELLGLKQTSGAATYFNAKSVAILQGKIRAMAKRYFRVTDLDYYRKCPFRFYLEKILGLEVDVPPRFEVEYRQWGNLAHRTMEYLYKDKNWELDAFEKHLFNALEKSLKDIPIGDFWVDVTRKIFHNLLPLLKKQEAEIRMKGFFPGLVEERVEAEIAGTKLRGKIDRIDKRQGKEQRTLSTDRHDTVILLDYKTGDVDKKSLQLPLYARIWQERQSEQVDAVGFYSLKEGRVIWYPTRQKSLEEFIQEALQETADLIDQMKKGMFPAKPVSTECRICDHGALCGKT